MQATETKSIDQAIADYCEKLTAAACRFLYDGRAETVAGSGIKYFHEAGAGTVYTRIVRVERLPDGRDIARSAVAFVKRDDGSIWKPAGWKGPAKNFSRGNVYSLPDVVAWSL